MTFKTQRLLASAVGSTLGCGGRFHSATFQVELVRHVAGGATHHGVG